MGRRECLGVDRAGTRYWWLGQVFSDEDGAVVDPGCVFAESPAARPPQQQRQQGCGVGVDPLAAGDDDDSTRSLGGSAWGLYSTGEKVLGILFSH
jgi:hypothetical protein